MVKIDKKIFFFKYDNSLNDPSQFEISMSHSLRPQTFSKRSPYFGQY
jgi:hypothetical protein